MGKSARIERRRDQAARTRHQAAAMAANMAGRGAEVVQREVVAALNREYRRHIVTMDLDAFVRDRSHWSRRTTWASWCWYPSALVAGRLYRVFQPDTPDRGRVVESPAVEHAATSLAALVAWQHSRLVVVFDPDAAAAIGTTSRPDDLLPAEVLRHLPAWSLWLDLSHLHPLAGAFIALDTDHITPLDTRAGFRLPHHHRPVEALTTVIVLDDDVVVSRVALTDESVSDCFAGLPRSSDYERRASRFRPAGADRIIANAGGDLPGFLAHVMGLVLYLCSVKPDVQRVGPAAFPTGRVSADSVPATALEAGFRIGAALRNDRDARTKHLESEAPGRRVAAHLRRAHWHTYWTGPMNSPDQRVHSLRWLPPIPVNTDLDDGHTVTIRPVASREGPRPAGTT